jgi:hypothetical protein
MRCIARAALISRADECVFSLFAMHCDVSLHFTEATYLSAGHEILQPPDIVMHCNDGDVKTTIRVTWDMSWSDVLDTLKATFGRAVIFEYENVKHIRTLCGDEDAFDVFCSDCEQFGCQASVCCVSRVHCVRSACLSSHDNHI